MSFYEDAVDRGYDGPPSGGRRHQGQCGGYASVTGHCGALDCETCYPGHEDSTYEETAIETVRSSKTRTAQKARFQGQPNEIRPGDKVSVSTGVRYQRGGARIGFLPRIHTRISKGPAWPEEGS